MARKVWARNMAKCMYMTVSSLFFSLPPFLPSFFSFVCAVSLFLLQKYCTTPAQNVRTCFMLSHRIRLSYAFFFFFFPNINARGQDESCIKIVFNWNIKMNVFSFTLKVSYICNKEFSKNYCKNRCEPEVVSSENMLLALHCKFTVEPWFHEDDEITSEWKS